MKVPETMPHDSRVNAIVDTLSSVSIKPTHSPCFVFYSIYLARGKTFFRVSC